MIASQLRIKLVVISVKRKFAKLLYQENQKTEQGHLVRTNGMSRIPFFKFQVIDKGLDLGQNVFFIFITKLQKQIATKQYTLVAI